jgi:hypothetical protein
LFSVARRWCSREWGKRGSWQPQPLELLARHQPHFEISKARVTDGVAVMKAKEEKARQAYRAAARTETKEQRATARVEAAKVKPARAVATNAKGKGKAVAVADVPDAAQRREKNWYISKSQSVVRS